MKFLVFVLMLTTLPLTAFADPCVDRNSGSLTPPEKHATLTKAIEDASIQKVRVEYEDIDRLPLLKDRKGLLIFSDHQIPGYWFLKEVESKADTDVWICYGYACCRKGPYWHGVQGQASTEQGALNDMHYEANLFCKAYGGKRFVTDVTCEQVGYVYVVE